MTLNSVISTKFHIAIYDAANQTSIDRSAVSFSFNQLQNCIRNLDIFII